MSEQNMRKALEEILKIAEELGGMTQKYVEPIARKALGQQTAATAELTDMEIDRIADQYALPIIDSGHFAIDAIYESAVEPFARAVIAAHEAKKNGGAA